MFLLFSTDGIEQEFFLFEEESAAQTYLAELEQVHAKMGDSPEAHALPYTLCKLPVTKATPTGWSIEFNNS